MLHHALRAAGRRFEFLGFVGSGSGTALSLAGLDLRPGDFVVAFSTNDTENAGNMPSSPSAGWTVDHHATLSYQKVYVVHKTMGASPDSTVTLKWSSTFGVMGALAFRGVSSAASLDAIATANSTDNPPSATASISRALSVPIVALSGEGTGVPNGAPAGWEYGGGVVNTAGTSTCVVCAYRVLDDAGPYNPEGITGGSGWMYGSALHLIYTS